MKKLLWIKSAACIFTAGIMLSCNSAGLGVAVDLEAPVLEITSPSRNAFIGKQCTITGTAQDNRGVTSVELVVKYKDNGKDKNFTRKAKLSVTNEDRNLVKYSWTYVFDAAKDMGVGVDDKELEITITAHDDAENSSEDSSKNLNVMMDTKNAVLNGMNIRKNGKTTINLLSRTELDEIRANPDNNSYKAYFQNEEFTICAKLSDNYAVKKATLTLYAVKGIGDDMVEVPVVENRGIDNPDTANLYAPEYTFKESDFKNLPDVGDGKEGYILKPQITVTDTADNTIIASMATPYLCWDPDYDAPHFRCSFLKKDNRFDGNDNTEYIEVPENFDLPVEIFDDDQLAYYEYLLVSEDKYIDFKKAKTDSEIFEANRECTNTSDILYGANEKDADGKYKLEGQEVTDNQFSISTKNTTSWPVKAGIYKLIMKISDKKLLSGYSAKTRYVVHNLWITSANVPFVVVDSPIAESSPSLSSGEKFTLTGYVLDDDDVSKVTLAWAPFGTKNSEILAALKEYNFGNGKEPSNGIKIYKLTTTSDTDPASGKKKSTFSKEFNVTTDFMVNGKVENKQKTFVVLAKDTAGNMTDRSHTIGAYTDVPDIDVKYGDMTTGPWAEFTEQAQSHLPSDVYFKVAFTGKNNLKIVSTGAECDVKEDKVGNPFKCVDETNHIYKYDTSNAETDGGQFKYPRVTFAFTAKDVLGNESVIKKIIIFQEKPVLQELTTDAQGTVQKAGEKIQITADFDMNFKLDGFEATLGNSYIQLGNIYKKTGADANGFTYEKLSDEDARAVYVKGYDTSSLIYEFEVKENYVSLDGSGKAANVIFSGDTEKKRHIEFTENISESVKNAFELQEKGRIKYAAGGLPSVKIDVVDPDVVSFTPAKRSVDTGVIKCGVVEKENGSVTLKFKFNEPMNKESGTVELKRTEGWYIPPVLGEDVFLQLLTKASAAQRYYLHGSSGLVGKKEKLYLKGSDSRVAVGPYRQNTHGILSSGAPDTSTKYVLAFGFDIANDSSTNEYVEPITDEGGAPITVKKIRETLEALGYHKTSFEVSAFTLSTDRTEASLKISDSDFIDGLKNGVEYNIQIPAGAFSDDVGHPSKVINCNFYVGPTATPVIRIDRITSDGNKFRNKPEISSADDFKKYFGKTSFKIDSETPGATITYYKDETKNTGTDGAGKDSQHDSDMGSGYAKHYYLDDIQISSISAPNTAYDAGNTNTVGDGKLTGQKCYISAKASSPVEGMGESSIGYEGAFKTMVSFEEGNERYYYGSNIPEGTPSIAGWPLMQNGSAAENSRKMYKISGNDIFISWELLDNYMNQCCHNGRDNGYQNPADGYCRYGEAFIGKYKHY